MLQSMTLDLILTAEAARIAHVASETIRLWERQGRLSAIKTSRGVRLFDRADVERLARERAVAVLRAERATEVPAWRVYSSTQTAGYRSYRRINSRRRRARRSDHRVSQPR
jgi:predicted site-specific integrase-resolvase